MRTSRCARGALPLELGRGGETGDLRGGGGMRDGRGDREMAPAAPGVAEGSGGQSAAASHRAEGRDSMRRRS